MSPEKKPAAPESPAALKFVGHADVFVDGVPQTALEVVDEPTAVHQVSPKLALALLKTGLYVAADKYEPPAAAKEG